MFCVILKTSCVGQCSVWRKILTGVSRGFSTTLSHCLCIEGPGGGPLGGAGGMGEFLRSKTRPRGRDGKA